MDDNLNVLIIASRSDLAQARRLQSFLQKYKVPKHLVGQESRDGQVPAKIHNVEISLEQPLADDSSGLSARYAIVLCSPESVASADVHNWLLAYKQKHNENRILCYILAGEPNASDKPESGLKEAFPEAVRFIVDQHGQLTSERTEPIAADSREHADGEKNARLKLLAGVLAVRYEGLRQRAKKQQQRRLAIAAAAVISVIGYGANLLWQQQQQAQAKLQTEFISASKATFDALNRQHPDAMQQVTNLRQLARQVEDSQTVIQALDFRLRHSQLNPAPVLIEQDVELLLVSHQGQVFAASLTDGKLDLVSQDATTSVFELPGVVWDSGISFEQVSKLVSIEIIDNSLAWAVIDEGDSWYVAKLDLHNNIVSAQTAQTSRRMQNREYPRRSENIERDLNLRSGQVLVITDGEVGIYDANQDKSFLAPLPNGLTPEDLSYDIRLDWHRQAEVVLLWHKTQGVWPWNYAQASEFEAAIFSGESEAVIILDDGWLGINQTDADYNYTNSLIQLLDKRRLDQIPGHVVWLDVYPQQLRLLTSPDVTDRGEVILDAQTGQVLHSRRIDYRLGGGAEKGEKYYLNKGYLYRQSRDYLTALGRWPVACGANYQLAGDGSLHCLTEGQWQYFNVTETAPQFAVTLPGYIQSYTQQGDKLWVIANTEKSTFNVIERQPHGLALNYQQQAQSGCYHRLDPVNSEFVYVMLSAGSGSFFEGGPCSVAPPFTNAAFVIDGQQQLVSIENLFNMDLTLGKGTYTPAYDIDGVYQDKTNRHWFTTQSGILKRGEVMQPFVWNDQTQPIYFSRNPSTGELAVSEYRLSEDGQAVTLSLTIRNENGDEVKREILSKTFDVNAVAQEYWLHGFSADGKLFWWAPYGEAGKVSWIDLRQQPNDELAQHLPQQMHVALDHLKFSQSGNFVIHAEPFTTGRHRVFSTSTGKMVFESTSRDSFMMNKTRIDFHSHQPWLIYDGTAYDLSAQAQPMAPNYPDSIMLFDFHPQRPWAAGRCGEQDVCIVDLLLGQVVMLKTLERPGYTLETKPEQIRFSQDGNSLFYVLAGRSLVEQRLFSE